MITQKMTQHGKQLHLKIAEMIEKDILEDGFHLGDKMFSVRELCKQHDVSNRTAAKAVQNLISRGTLKSIPGKGTFINTIPSTANIIEELAPLKQVILVYKYSVHGNRNSFISEIIGEILEAASHNGLNIQTKLCTDSSFKNAMTLPFVVEPGDGTIILSGHPNLAMLALLGTGHHRCVLVDSISLHAPSVVTDNCSGMRQLVQHLVNFGHKKFVLALIDRFSANVINENERREAFIQYTRDLGVCGEIITGSEPEDFIDLFKQCNPPTAIMFTRDDPAIEFIQVAIKQGIRVPEQVNVTGFDDFSSYARDLSVLTTVRVDRKEMGRVAFETLKNEDRMSNTFFQWKRIPCELIVRKTTAEIK